MIEMKEFKISMMIGLGGKRKTHQEVFFNFFNDILLNQLDQHLTKNQKVKNCQK